MLTFLEAQYYPEPDCHAPPHCHKRLAARARSIRHKQPFVAAGTAAAVHYLCLLAAATCAVLLVLRPTQHTTPALVICLALTVASWLVALFKRKAALCPLCKGSPLMHTGARPHANAVCLPSMNHGVSAVLSTIFTQQFTCMYCGCRFDLLRDSTSHSPASEECAFQGGRVGAIMTVPHPAPPSRRWQTPR
ncbi:MAG: hypothetical protein K9N23_04150 [Akkermansiaceae bacterium]|nr:hypothetical protein [Akkermansiaceae bacterium]